MDINSYYQSILPNNPFHSDNKVKCVFQLKEYIGIYNKKPNLLIIDNAFINNFKDYLNDPKFEEAFKGIQQIVVERCGKTRFELLFKTNT